MGKLIYSMTVSLDGFVAGHGGDIEWSAPSEELHRFHNEQVRRLSAYLCGRRLYETMLPWENADEQLLSSEVGREFAEIWTALPKTVFSRTLSDCVGNASLRHELVAEDVEQLKRDARGEIAVGGAGLAATLIARGLVDEYRLFVSAIVLGGGTPYFPPLATPIALRLLEARPFDSRVLYLRYRALASAG